MHRFRGTKANFQTYKGTINPKTTLRNGFGVFKFANAFFEYEGSYLEGKKNGPGILRMRNGTVIRVGVKSPFSNFPRQNSEMIK